MYYIYQSKTRSPIHLNEKFSFTTQRETKIFLQMLIEKKKEQGFIVSSFDNNEWVFFLEKIDHSDTEYCLIVLWDARTQEEVI